MALNEQQIFTGTEPVAPRSNNSLMAAPLITAGKTIGAILIYTHKVDAFDEADLETLETVAFQVASAIEYAQLLRKTREMAIVDERTRLARDMHDGVAQNLAYLLIQVDRCLTMVDEDSKLEQQLESIGGLLEQNIDELRRNIFNLRPVDLDGKSLVQVLENFVKEFGPALEFEDRVPDCTSHWPVQHHLLRVPFIEFCKKHCQTPTNMPSVLLCW